MSAPGAGQAPSASARVVVMTRRNCSLCDHAADAVARICAELGVGWTSQDVDTDPELRAEYGDRVPVLLVDGREHGYYRVEEARLRAALAGPAPAGRMPTSRVLPSDDGLGRADANPTRTRYERRV